MSMTVGICWPSPGRDPQPLFDARILDLLKQETAATALRVNFDHRRTVDEAVAHTEHLRANGWDVLPILDFDYARPDLVGYSTFCSEIAKLGIFPRVELGNEPNLLHKMPPERYAEVFSAGASAIRAVPTPTPQIYIACEATKPITKRIDYFFEVRKRVPSGLYDVAAIHPYRNPQPPSFTSFSSRRDELAYYQMQVPSGTGIAVTEVGWDLRGGVTEELQADYTYEELRIWESLGVDAVYIYSFTEPPPPTEYRFGVLTHDLRPRPVCAAIRKFQEERSHG